MREGSLYVAWMRNSERDREIEENQTARLEMKCLISQVKTYSGEP